LNEAKHLVATVADEQSEAPVEHFTQDPFDNNPYPGKQVVAVLLDIQVFAPDPHYIHASLSSMY